VTSCHSPQRLPPTPHTIALHLLSKWPGAQSQALLLLLSHETAADQLLQHQLLQLPVHCMLACAAARQPSVRRAVRRLCGGCTAAAT